MKKISLSEWQAMSCPVDISAFRGTNEYLVIQEMKQKKYQTM